MKNKTNIIFLALGIFGLLIMGVVIADTVLTQFTKSTSMNKAQRDFLLTKVPIVMDKGQPLPKEINPVINIECSTHRCEYSAFQDGIIASYDNIIYRDYCARMGDGKRCMRYDDINQTKCLQYNQICVDKAIYTLEEIQDKVSVLVTDMLSAYANSSMEEGQKTLTETSTGKIIITEKR